MIAVRQAVRTLDRHRGFAAVAVLSLGIAIALNTTMYGALATLLSSRLGVVAPEQLFEIEFLGDPARQLTAGTIDDALRVGLRTYAGATGIRAMRPNRDGRQPAAERGERFLRVNPVVVRHDFFEFLGKRPLEGRTFLAEDDGTAVAVVSDRLARRLFEERSPIGQAFTIDGDAFTVIGVIERYAGFGPVAHDVWMLRPPGAPEVRSNLLRLRSPEDTSAVKRELSVIGARLALVTGAPPDYGRFWMRPLRVTSQLLEFHKGFVAAVIAVLLVACANIGNLQLARGLARSRELAVRAAVGATRRDLVKHLVAESAVLAASGLLLGVVLTLWGIAGLKAYIPPEIDGYLVVPKINWDIFAFAAGAAVLCLLLVGLLPALRVSRVDPNSLLKAAAGTGANRAHRRRYGVLVVAQIGFALPVLIGAVVALKGAWRMHSPDFLGRNWYGYDPRPIVTSTVRVGGSPGVPSRALRPLAEDMAIRIGRVQGVTASAASYARAPLKRMVTVGDDDGAVREEMAHGWVYEAVTPGYFEVYGRGIAAGRGFRREGDENAVVIDAPTARFLWGARDPIGREIKLASRDSDAPWYTVIGVLDDMRDTFAIRRTMRDANYRLYGVYRLMSDADSTSQHPPGLRRTRPAILPDNRPRVELHARAAGSTELAAIRIQRELRALSPADKPTAVPLLWWMGGASVMQDFVASLFTLFALVGIALVAVGIYGIVSHSVEERRRELAVRISLGATLRNVLPAILREGNVLIMGGVAIGLYLSRDGVWWLGRFVDDDIGYDASLFARVAAGLFVFAVASALVPAIRAARIDPAEALRHE